ncbi:MAG TPA: excisionase family DNA-binding protein [Candidatus Angelobacter sp.]
MSYVSLACYHALVDLKSKREAAELLGLSTRGVERAVRRGQLTVVYRDSKHGKTAWFNPRELDQYKEIQLARGPVGFTSGIPPRPPGNAPPVGALIPMVEVEPRREPEGKRSANEVQLADRLTLSVDEAAQLAGLPRNFIVKSIQNAALKAIRIGRSYHVKRFDLDRFVQEL